MWQEPGALGPEDAEEVSEDLEPNSSALLIAFENVWAAKLVDALRAADAVMIDQIRIPADVVEAVLTAVRHQAPIHEQRGIYMGLLRMAARTAVVAGTATAVSGRSRAVRPPSTTSRAEAEQLRLRLRKPRRLSPRLPPRQDESMAKLQELAQLHNQGVLSDEEFTAAKAKILGI